MICFEKIVYFSLGWVGLQFNTHLEKEKLYVQSGSFLPLCPCWLFWPPYWTMLGIT